MKKVISISVTLNFIFSLFANIATIPIIATIKTNRHFIANNISQKLFTILIFLQSSAKIMTEFKIVKLLRAFF